MNILGVFKSIAKSLGLTKSGNAAPVQTAHKTEQLNSVNSVEIKDGVGDKLVINNKGDKKQPSSDKPKRTVGAIQEAIRIKCAKYGIEDISSEKLLEIPSEVYANLSEQEKQQVWSGVEYILDKMEEFCKKSGIKSKEKQKFVTLELIKLYTLDLQKGNIQEAKNLLDESGDINEELGGKDFDKKSKDEQDALMHENYSKWQSKKQSELKREIDKCPKNERSKRRAEIEARHRKQERVRFAQFNATHPPKVGFRGLRLMSPDSMAYGYDQILNSIENEEERQDFIDNEMTVEAELDLYQEYYKRGETPSKEDVNQIHAQSMAYKSPDAVKRYQEGYEQARKSGKYDRLEQDGIFTEMAAGNLAGAQLNTTMSIEEKKRFVENFYKSEQQFGDLDTVISKADAAIEKYIAKFYPNDTKIRKEIEEIKKHIKAEIEKKAASKSDKTSNSDKPQGRADAKQKNQAVTSSIGSVTPLILNNSYAAKNVVSNERKQAASDKIIETTLSSGSITLNEAIEQFKDEKKVYKVIFSNNNLVDRYEQAAINYIRRHNKVSDLIDIANSSKAVALIIAHNRVEQQDELFKQLDSVTTSNQKYMLKNKEQNAAVC